MSILTPKKISPLIYKLKQQQKKIVLAGGCFDILHLGHLIFLQKAKAWGDILIIFLESDEKIRRSKGVNRPLNPQKARAKILSALSVVDHVIMLPLIENSGYDNLVEKIKPDIIAITRGDLKVAHKKRAAKLVGAKLQYVCGRVSAYSTSNLILKLGLAVKI